MRVSAVILAAGQGTRIDARIPKVLLPLAGKPAVVHAIEAVRGITCETPVLVVGFGADQVRTAVGDQMRYVVQEQQLGTGHAVLQARPLLVGQSDAVLVIYGDMPLLRTRTLCRLVERHRQVAPAVTMLTMIQDDSWGYGRVIRDASGAAKAVVEESEATAKQLAIREMNAGVHCFESDWLWTHLERLPLSAKGEYFLTGMPALATAEGRKVETQTVHDPTEVLGVNTREQLAKAEVLLRRRLGERGMLDDAAA